MIRLRPLALTILLSAALSAEAADFSYQLSGLEGELEENVRAQLESLGLDAITVEGRYRARVRTGVRDGLRALGYYAPKLTFKWDPRPKEGSKEPRILRLTVDPGDPVRIEGAELLLEGDAANDRAFERMRRKLPKKGDVLHHGE